MTGGLAIQKSKEVGRKHHKRHDEYLERKRKRLEEQSNKSKKLATADNNGQTEQSNMEVMPSEQS